MKIKPHLAGILLMVGGMFLFTLNDALGKWLVADYPVGQILAVRSVAALLILLPYLWRRGLLAGPHRIEQPGLQALRASSGFHLITLQTSGVALAGAATLPAGLGEKIVREI